MGKFTCCITADTPAPGHNFQSQSPGHEAFQRPRVEAAGRSSGPLICRGLGGDLETLGPGVGVAAYAPKTEKIKCFPSFIRRKKSTSASAAPTGSGFRQSCPPSFQQEKAVSWPSKVNVFGEILSILPIFINPQNVVKHCQHENLAKMQCWTRRNSFVLTAAAAKINPSIIHANDMIWKTASLFFLFPEI